MTRNIWKFSKVLFVVVALVATVSAGTASAKRHGGGGGGGSVGSSVEGSEVTDNTLTGADINESTLQCTGPNGIPGCGGAGAPAASPTVTFGPAAAASFTPGQTSYDGRIVSKTISSECPTGTKVIGGATNWVGRDASDPVYIIESFKNNNAWVLTAGSDVSKDLQLNLVAVCIS